MEKEKKGAEKGEGLPAPFVFALRLKPSLGPSRTLTLRVPAAPSATCKMFPYEKDEDLQACAHDVGFWFAASSWSSSEWCSDLHGPSLPVKIYFILYLYIV